MREIDDIPSSSVQLLADLLGSARVPLHRREGVPFVQLSQVLHILLAKLLCRKVALHKVALLILENRVMNLAALVSFLVKDQYRYTTHCCEHKCDRLKGDAVPVWVEGV